MHVYIYILLSAIVVQIKDIQFSNILEVVVLDRVTTETKLEKSERLFKKHKQDRTSASNKIKDDMEVKFF